MTPPPVVVAVFDAQTGAPVAGASVVCDVTYDVLGLALTFTEAGTTDGAGAVLFSPTSEDYVLNPELAFATVSDSRVRSVMHTGYTAWSGFEHPDAVTWVVALTPASSGGGGPPPPGGGSAAASGVGLLVAVALGALAVAYVATRKG